MRQASLRKIVINIIAQYMYMYHKYDIILWAYLCEEETGGIPNNLVSFLISGILDQLTVPHTEFFGFTSKRRENGNGRSDKDNIKYSLYIKTYLDNQELI